MGSLISWLIQSTIHVCIVIELFVFGQIFHILSSIKRLNDEKSYLHGTHNLRDSLIYLYLDSHGVSLDTNCDSIVVRIKYLILSELIK